jgi:hypothetical protein
MSSFTVLSRGNAKHRRSYNYVGTLRNDAREYKNECTVGVLAGGSVEVKHANLDP